MSSVFLPIGPMQTVASVVHVSGGRLWAHDCEDNNEHQHCFTDGTHYCWAQLEPNGEISAFTRYGMNFGIEPEIERIGYGYVS